MIPLISLPPNIPIVPFYSQFADISSPSWKKVGCGITSLAMVLDYYQTEPVSVNELLKQGLKAGAYSNASGWSYSGLISVAKKHGLEGTTSDFGKSSMATALKEITKSLEGGPVIASIHYKFDPKNPIPHLVVINGISNGNIYYNDPAAKDGELKISLDKFLLAWKKRFIVIRPVKNLNA